MQHDVTSPAAISEYFQPNMISLVVVAAAALVATTAGASSSVYPFPSFTRSMSTLDPYGQSYCFLTGGTGVIQGTGSQQYLGVQPCYYGQIGIYGSELGFGLIGNSASASADLGTVNELGWRYNLTQNAFFSLRYDGGNLVVGQGAETKTLSSSDTDSLLVTESLHTIAPIPGHVYLVRVTEGGSTSNWADSALFARVIVLDYQTSATVTTAQVVWDVIYGATSSPETVDEVASQASTALAVGGAALGLVLFVILDLIIISVVLYRRTNFNSSLYASINNPK